MENENMNPVDTTETVEVQEQEVKTYTAEEVAKLVASEADKRVSQALKTQAKKYEQKLSLSKLDESSRIDAEQKMRIAELEEKLAGYEIEKNKSELKTVLSARGLSAEFADIVHITDDIEESQSRIDTLDKLFKAAVAAEVKKRLASANPQMGNDGGNPVEFGKMSLADRQNLYNTNPDLYKKLSGH
ncbi:MAG: DUF4355 domain-containing protein [Paludibacteraceae bacterium]|nr:DUF4355 domain-containing protein [Paludibacteraceae bacterium]